MTILEELMSEIKNNNSLEQIRIICDKIYEEEKDKQKYLQTSPKGSRIFLSLEVPGNTIKEIGFITLEIEDEDHYIIGYYTIQISIIEDSENNNPRLKKIWHIETNKPNKVLQCFAQKMKMLKGE